VTSTQPDTLILGGGISGLLAAWHLRRAGQVVEVWEASEIVGGWAQTLAWPGPSGEPGWLERGPQGLRLGRDGTLVRLCRELDLSFAPDGPKGPRWVGKGGRRLPSPATPRGLLTDPDLGLAAKLRMLAEPFIGSGPEEEDLHGFFARRLGVGFAQECLPSLIAGILAAPPERLGVEALPRLRSLEARGGLLLGALRDGPEATRLLRGGTGALAQTLAERLGCVQPERRAQSLEALPGDRWRVQGQGISLEAAQLVLALPTPEAAALLEPVAAPSAALLAAIPTLDLQVWHSRHAPVPGWERGLGLLLHPPEGRGLLGAVALAADDPRGVPGLLQLRTYLGGAFPIAEDLATWPGVCQELRHWLPELGPAVQVREEPCPGAFPLLAPGHTARLTRLLEALPPGLHWLGAARFGPGLPDLAEGIEAWAKAFPAR
jgi:oxygen-dependent protoporphyrinogen oxidase